MIFPRFCQDSAPDVTTSSNTLRVVFTSNKKKHAAGAVCTAECVSGEEPVTTTPTTGSTGSTPTAPTTTGETGGSVMFCLSSSSVLFFFSLYLEMCLMNTEPWQCFIYPTSSSIGII